MTIVTVLDLFIVLKFISNVHKFVGGNVRSPAPVISLADQLMGDLSFIAT